MAEALKKLREADNDESRTTAMKEVERLEGEASKIDAPAAMPSTVEAMTEAAPALVKTLREAATKKVEEEKEALATQLREAQAKLGEADTFISGITDVQGLVKAIREAGVTDEVEVRHFVHQAKVRKLSEAADVKDMVEGERAYVKAQEEKQLKALREAMNAYDLPEVEGAFGRTPEGGDTTGTGGVDLLRESGVPLKTPTAA
jgi:membrane protein involved in colicin uptake